MNIIVPKREVTNRIMIFTWNVCFGCMTANHPNVDRTAGWVAEDCKTRDPELGCSQMINQFILKNPSDFYAFQECTSHERLTCLVQYGKVVQLTFVLAFSYFFQSKNQVSFL